MKISNQSPQRAAAAAPPLPPLSFVSSKSLFQPKKVWVLPFFYDDERWRISKKKKKNPISIFERYMLNFAYNVGWRAQTLFNWQESAKTIIQHFILFFFETESQFVPQRIFTTWKSAKRFEELLYRELSSLIGLETFKWPDKFFGSAVPGTNTLLFGIFVFGYSFRSFPNSAGVWQCLFVSSTIGLIKWNNYITKASQVWKKNQV